MKKIMRIGKALVAPLFIPLLILAALIIGFVLIKKAIAEPVDTYHSRWHLVRETADQDGDTRALCYNFTTQGNFANKDSSTVAAGGPFHIVSSGGGVGPHEGMSPGGAWMFAICGLNYDVANDNVVDNTFSFNVVGWSKTNGMLQNICEGSGILGTQAVIVYPDDDADALGMVCSETGVTYTDSSKTFTVTNEGFDGAAVGMMAYVTGTNLTDGYYAVTTATDVNTIIMSGMTSTGDNTDSTVDINPAFWVDTITLDETTKWPSVAVYNSADNEVAVIVMDTTGLEWVQFILYACDGASGIEAGDLTVYGRRY